MQTRAGMAGAWLLVAIAAPASAVPPSICRQRMVGIFRSDTRGEARIRVRLTVRDDIGALSLNGPFRCTPRRGAGPCAVASARLDGFNRWTGVRQLGRDFTLFLRQRRPGDQVVTVCNLDGTVPFMMDDRIPAMAGTYECTGDDGVPDSGVFGLIPQREGCP